MCGRMKTYLMKSGRDTEYLSMGYFDTKLELMQFVRKMMSIAEDLEQCKITHPKRNVIFRLDEKNISINQCIEMLNKLQTKFDYKQVTKLDYNKYVQFNMNSFANQNLK